MHYELEADFVETVTSLDLNFTGRNLKKKEALNDLRNLTRVFEFVAATICPDVSYTVSRLDIL